VALRDINPWLLRSFVVLAEELHLTRAATRLALAPPTLASDVRRLEDLLDRRLFVQTPQTCELTPSGEAVLLAARELLDR
jgi:DNA-binding transcriptional LysR family regulator